MRRTVLFLAITSLIASSFVLAMPAFADTLVVDDDGMGVSGNCDDVTATHSTLTAAIAAAAAGDTIVVCPGTYAENVDVNKALTIVGAKAGESAGPTACPTVRGSAAEESEITGVSGGQAVEISSTGATTFDGFTVNSAAGVAGQSAFYITGGAGHVIQNNIMVAGHAIPTGTASGVKSQVLDDVDINNNNVMGFLFGMNLDSLVSTGAPSVVDSNCMSGNSALGLILQGGTNGAPDGQTVTNNLIQNNGAGIVMGPGNSDILDNTIQNNTGTGITNAGTPRATNNEAHNNNIVGNGTGIDNRFDESVNAECNWYGSASGPMADDNPTGTGDSIVENPGEVDYTPWLTSSWPGGACEGTPPTPPSSKDDCKKGGWQSLTDDQGRPFKNQGDCVSYAATGGTNKADG